MDALQPPSFGTLLRRYRLAANLSQAALAERARLSTRAISDLERGVRRSPYRDTVRQLGAALALEAPALTLLHQAARGPRVSSSPRQVEVEQGAADDPLLETKLALPPPRPVLVARPHLIQRLRQTVSFPLTLIVAPAGSGKTTLLSAWGTTAGQRRSVAWVALDGADNDPARFWRYVLAALERVAPGCAAAATTLLGPVRSGGARRSRPIETIVTCLVNDLSTRITPLILALDDYHLIESPAIHAGMVFLLERPPPCLHLVLISRADPPLPLARWRARGRLVELRAADLRFTPEEAATFLCEVMGLPLSPADAGALEARTEGWIAGLQLAALALQGRAVEAIAPFISTFSGSNRYVVDYLSEEVLSRQSAAVRDFLLHTCVLERLSAGLCAAMLGRPEPGTDGTCQALLEELERSNVFLIPLDDHRHWYRYHHLFADALRGRLAAGEGPPRAVLHRRAGEWLGQHGLHHEAIDHLLAAGAHEEAAGLIEALAIPTVLQGAWQTLTSWLDALPAGLVRSHPRLCVVQALLLLDGYSADQVESSLHDAERALQGAVPREDDRNTWGEVAAVRALVAALRGDVPAILTQAHRALDCLDTANDAFRGVTEACLGAAYIGLDDLDRAEQIFAATARAARTRGNVGMCLAVTEDLTYVRRARGRLGAAIDTGEETLAWSAERTGMSHPFRAALHLSLADLLCERHELEAAAYHLREAFARPTSWNLLISQSVSLFVQAHLQGAGGDPAAALATLGELDTLTARQGWPWLSAVIDAYRAQLWLARGDVPAAAGWITRAGTAPAAPMVALSSQFSVFAYEHLSIAPIQVLLARGRAAADPESLRAALQMAMHQQQRAVAAGTPWLRIKALVLQALAWDALGAGDRAVSLLREAIIAAAAERYIQLFAEEGLPLAPLLTGLSFPGAAGAVSPAYLQRVLEACGAGNSRSSTGLGTAHRPSGPSGAPTPAV